MFPAPILATDSLLEVPLRSGGSQWDLGNRLRIQTRAGKMVHRPNQSPEGHFWAQVRQIELWADHGRPPYAPSSAEGAAPPNTYPRSSAHNVSTRTRTACRASAAGGKEMLSPSPLCILWRTPAVHGMRRGAPSVSFRHVQAGAMARLSHAGAIPWKAALETPLQYSRCDAS